jgi:hypothetical protein
MALAAALAEKYDCLAKTIRFVVGQRESPLPGGKSSGPQGRREDCRGLASIVGGR